MPTQIRSRVPKFPLPSFLYNTRSYNIKDFLNFYKEPCVTYAITPNSVATDDDTRYSRSPSSRDQSTRDSIFKQKRSYNILASIHSNYSKFYLPQRVHFENNRVFVKLNDTVSYKIYCNDNVMKFYITIPKREIRKFMFAIKNDWGSVDITKVGEEYIDFNPALCSSAIITSRHSNALSTETNVEFDKFYKSLASLCSSIPPDNKFIIDINMEPVVNESLKSKLKLDATRIKHGRIVDKNNGVVDLVINKTLGLFMNILYEITRIIETVMDGGNSTSDTNSSNDILKVTQNTNEKTYADSKLFKTQIRTIAQSESPGQSKYILTQIGNCFSELDSDNSFRLKPVSKRKTPKLIEAVKHNNRLITEPYDILYQKELNPIINLPHNETLRNYSKAIDQDNFTRVDIDESFYSNQNGALPIALSLDKEEKLLHLKGYKRDWWTDKGRKALDEHTLDDRCRITFVSGTQGGGKTEILIKQALHTFGAHLPKEDWKHESKSVVLFDVADGSTIYKIYNSTPDYLKDRIIILNHSNISHPIPVNNRDLSDFSLNVLEDGDFAYEMAENESRLINDILEKSDSILTDRWLSTSLQCAYLADKDYGLPEAIRLLIDDDFRINDILPKITDERLAFELEIYNDMRNNGQANQIIQTIQNRLTVLEKDAKLWDCIAQRPLRDEKGNIKNDLRKWMNGDEDGAYMVLIYIPKTGISNNHRRYVFSHYLLKIWYIALTREKEFGGRIYRPETLVIIDEIHQVIDIRVIAEKFIEFTKEPRKYSLRLLVSMHGWSSFSSAPKGFQSSIQSSIADNGCNLIILKGGDDVFNTFSKQFHPLKLADMHQLNNDKFCAIFSISQNHKLNVFKAKLLPQLTKLFPQTSDWDSHSINTFVSPYSRPKSEVRKDNLDRLRETLRSATLELNDNLGGDINWEGLEEAGMID